jgi:hypothetical protein
VSATPAQAVEMPPQLRTADTPSHNWIYFRPGQLDYAPWFCSEEEAQALGGVRQRDEDV